MWKHYEMKVKYLPLLNIENGCKHDILMRIEKSNNEMQSTLA